MSDETQSGPEPGPESMTDRVQKFAYEKAGEFDAYARKLGVLRSAEATQNARWLAAVAREIRESCGGETAPMTSDPKHLPPRDCLVLIECPDGYSAQPVFVHVLFEEESGDYDEEGRICGHADRWMDAVEGEEIDPSRVITWRELPEVE